MFRFSFHKPYTNNKKYLPVSAIFLLILYGYEWISMFFQVQSLVKLFPPRVRKHGASKDAELFTVRKEKSG